MQPLITDTKAPVTEPGSTRHYPGEGGVWVLLGGELLLFTICFFTFVYYRQFEPDVFAASRLTVNQGIGLANTLVLLTSSLFVALGVKRFRARDASASRLFQAALLCGGIFAALKAYEYYEKVSHGLTPLTNNFYMCYFAFTGMHLSHVFAGSIMLFLMARVAKRPKPTAAQSLFVECGALFWHLVDLLWIMLFALFYLAG